MERFERDKRRFHAEAIERLQWIINTFAEEFSVAEIERERGIDLFDEGPDEFRLHLAAALLHLVELGYVEIIDREEQTYRLVVENIPEDML